MATDYNRLDTSANVHTAEAAEGIRSEEMLLNMGPQHPSTHGVLRLVLTLQGETIIECTPVIGYLHRGMEKIFENRTLMQGIRYTDNSDYLSPMLCEIAYAGAAEQLMGLEIPRRAQYIRLLVGELQRIASHLVAVGNSLLRVRASWSYSKPWPAAVSPSTICAWAACCTISRRAGCASAKPGSITLKRGWTNSTSSSMATKSSRRARREWAS